MRRIALKEFLEEQQRFQQEETEKKLVVVAFAERGDACCKFHVKELDLVAAGDLAGVKFDLVVEDFFDEFEHIQSQEIWKQLSEIRTYPSTFLLWQNKPLQIRRSGFPISTCLSGPISRTDFTDFIQFVVDKFQFGELNTSDVLSCDF